jgi:DNA repair exonuclease SbcCD ATPase subunit
MAKFGKLGITNSTILEAEIESLSKGIAQLDIETSKLRDEVTMREQQVASFSQISDEVEKLAREAQTYAAAAREGRELLTALDRKIGELEDNLSSFDRITTSLEKAKSDLGSLDELLSYQTELYELSRIEASFPETERKLKELKNKIERLAGLEQALTEIKEAAVNVQTEVATNILESIRGKIGETYAGLAGHPYYNRLGIAAEVSRGRNVYWITAEGEKYGTYVQTRFSTAQLNITALALFLTMSKQLPHNLGFIMLDDPTQSMDVIHTETLARALAEEMNRKQILIATQDVDLRRRLDEAAPEGAFKTVQIGGWSQVGPAFA